MQGFWTGTESNSASPGGGPPVAVSRADQDEEEPPTRGPLL